MYNQGIGDIGTATLMNGAGINTTNYAVGTAAVQLKASLRQYEQLPQLSLQNAMIISFGFRFATAGTLFYLGQYQISMYITSTNVLHITGFVQL